jgi:hypothetical protein
MHKQAHKHNVVHLHACIFSRTDYCGRGELADRQQKLGQMMAMLKKVRAAVTVTVSTHQETFSLCIN